VAVRGPVSSGTAKPVSSCVIDFLSHISIMNRVLPASMEG